ncbi:MAG TPA: GNAT family N-acetyltransferase [Jiangellales bacterium]|nr:GNAT family N-acetyltransferase [Jiangellales bacterium]
MSHAIRAASHADVDAMAEVWALADGKRRTDIGLSATVTVEQARHLVVDRLGRAGSIPVVARDGEQVVAMAIGLPAREHDGAGRAVIPGLLHVTLVSVVPSAWGRRLAARVLTTLLDDARLAGYTAAQVWAHESNTRAIAVYERLGFTRTSRTKIDIRGEIIAQWHRTLT